MNNKAYAQIVIPGIIIAIITFGFEMWAFGLVYDAVEPELEKALLQLEDNMICPPEFQDSESSVCFGKMGEIIINGRLKNDLKISLDTGDICQINAGEYDNNHICTLNGLWEAENMYFSGVGIFNKKTIQISKLFSYLQSGKYIRVLRILKYLPK